ncbi:MAG TPA: hypothetical protein VF590_04550 [Isosphaeraceae bacterium]
MRRVLRWVLGLILVLGGVRALGFLAYAFYQLPTPLEAFHLEATMVHACWRVEAGRRLYPPWTDGPYVLNFYAPAYFLAVGWLGRLAGAGLDDLTRIGRAVSFASAVLMAPVLALAVGRRHGRGAGLVAGVLSLGGAPLFGFGVMARPDVPANLLGAAGFLLIEPGSLRRQLGGGVLLALAILTKQTAAVYLVAAAAGLLARGAPREAAGVALGCLLAVGAVVAALTAGPEPNCAACLVAEGWTALDLANWRKTLLRVATLSPDLIAWAGIGLVLWGRGPARDPKLFALALIAAVADVAAAVRRGADLNYVLDLRVVAALAAGSLWAAGRAPGARHPGWRLALAVAGAGALVPGTVLAVEQALHARGLARRLASPAGRAALRGYRELFRMAEDPGARLLTDCGLLALHQKERAPFVDPWLFRLLVETGRIRPTPLQEALRSEAFDLVVSTADWGDPGYAWYEFGLPMALVEAARDHYRLAGTRAGLFLYVPRRGARRPGESGRSDPGRGARPGPSPSRQRVQYGPSWSGCQRIPGMVGGVRPTGSATVRTSNRSRAARGSAATAAKARSRRARRSCRCSGVARCAAQRPQGLVRIHRCCSASKPAASAPRR